MLPRKNFTLKWQRLEAIIHTKSLYPFNVTPSSVIKTAAISTILLQHIDLDEIPKLDNHRNLRIMIFHEEFIIPDQISVKAYIES